jgi:hypothetical protein
VRTIELGGAGLAPHLSVFEGASSGLVDDSDIQSAGGVLNNGTFAALLVYENRWATPLVEAIGHGGGEVVAAGFIPHSAIVSSLDASESVAG